MTAHPLTILDWKSSASGFVGAEMLLQLGGYYGTTHYFDTDALTWLPQDGRRPTQGAIVNIRPDKCRVLVSLTQADLETALGRFHECLDVFLWLVDKGFAKLPEREEYRVGTRQFPSVTYIIQHVIAKPGLLDWSYGIGVEAGLRAPELGWTPPEIAEALAVKAELDAKRLKKTDPAAQPWVKLRDALTTAGYGPTAKRDAAATTGTSWHKTILFFLQGTKVDLTSAPPDQIGMLTHFERWNTQVGLEPKQLETKVANVDFGWAGTWDCLGMCNLEGG